MDGDGRKPIFSFGLLADIQYSNMDDTFVEGRRQRFREVPDKLSAAVADFISRRRDLSFVLALGDIINGNRERPGETDEDLETVAVILDRLAPDLITHHTLGNHCLEVPREVVLERLHMPASYYSVSLPAAWRLLILDTTDMSGHSQADPASESGREAEAYLVAHPLSEEHPQMSPWNGGLGSKQLTWLKGQLQKAVEVGEKVIVTGHHQAGPGAVRKTHAAWNWPEMVDILSSCPAVKLYLAGHDHEGGYAQHAGIHWVTLEAMLEAPMDSNAYAVVDVFPDRIVINGKGTVTSRTLPF